MAQQVLRNQGQNWRKRRKTRELSRYKLTSPEKATFYRLHDWLAEMLKFQNPIIFRLPKELFTTCLSVSLPYHPQDGQVKSRDEGQEWHQSSGGLQLTSLIYWNQLNWYSHQSIWKVFWFVTFICSFWKTSNDWPHGNMLSWTNWICISGPKPFAFGSKRNYLPFTQRWEVFLQQWF